MSIDFGKMTYQKHSDQAVMWREVAIYIYSIMICIWNIFTLPHFACAEVQFAITGIFMLIHVALDAFQRFIRQMARYGNDRS